MFAGDIPKNRILGHLFFTRIVDQTVLIFFFDILLAQPDSGESDLNQNEESP